MVFSPAARRRAFRLKGCLSGAALVPFELQFVLEHSGFRIAIQQNQKIKNPAINIKAPNFNFVKIRYTELCRFFVVDTAFVLHGDWPGLGIGMIMIDRYSCSR